MAAAVNYDQAMMMGAVSLTFMFFWLWAQLRKREGEEESIRTILFQGLAPVFFFIGLYFALNTTALMKAIGDAGVAPAAVIDTSDTYATVLTWVILLALVMTVLDLLFLVLDHFRQSGEGKYRWQPRKS